MSRYQRTSDVNFEALVPVYLDITVVPPVQPLVLEETLTLQPNSLDDTFESILKHVNVAKDKLGELYTKKDPSARGIMSDVDLYTDTKFNLKKHHNFEVSTNASLKMIEMLAHHNLIPKLLKRKEKFLALHNAELPGAFIMAIKKYLEFKFPERASAYEWRACSFYPESAKDIKALGDVYGIYSKNRGNWLMGPKPNGLLGEEVITGDMTERKSLEKIAETLQSLGGADLYTSDIGIDVSQNYNLQEEMTAILHFGQVVCGLMSLADKGILLVKTYTFTHQFSRSVVALLASLFDEVHITKPMTSRPANSETYLVAEGFKKFLFTDKIKEQLLRLLEWLAAKNEKQEWSTSFGALVPLEPETDVSILRAASLIHDQQQVRVLDETVRLFHKYTKQPRQLAKDISQLKAEKSREYIRDYLM